MSALTGEQAPPGAGDGPAWSPANRRWDRLRLAVLLGWLLVLLATPLVGERAASWSDVQTLVATGDVDSVRISGEMGPGTTGYGVVAVHWRHGLLRYEAQVVQVRGRHDEQPGRALANDEHAPLVHGRPSVRLSSLQPGLHVDRSSVPPNDNRMFGFRVGNALGGASLVLFLTGFVVLVAGPQPWRATRWAWFWLLLPPVGVAFAALAGPTPFVRPARPGHRRLTGGWAFLLSAVLSSALAAWRW